MKIQVRILHVGIAGAYMLAIWDVDRCVLSVALAAAHLILAAL
jgi:hypothetical protein